MNQRPIIEAVRARRASSCPAASTLRSARSRPSAARRASSRARRARASPTSTATRSSTTSMSWGPMIHGHAPRGPHARARAAGAARHELRRAEPARSRARRAGARAGAVDGARALRQLGHRSDDERGARGARGDAGATRSSSSRAAITATPTAFSCRPARARSRFGTPTSPGVPAGAVANTLLASFNDLASVERLVARQSPDRSPAIIIEPVAGNMGVVLPEPGFLAGAARRSAIAQGMLLIFDEVMTGFRLAPGGAQAALRRHAGSHLPRQDHRRRSAGRRVRRTRRSDGPGVARRARLSGRHALRQSARDGRGTVVAETLDRAASTAS